MRHYSCEHCIKTEDNPKAYESVLSDLSNAFGDDAKFCPYCGRYLHKAIFHQQEEMVTELVDSPSAFEDEVEESHRSYAQASFTRTHTQKSSMNTLYGSSIRHQHVITFRLKRSYKSTSKYSDHYSAVGLPLVEFEMSQSQFAELITTMNMGEGVPVTLKAVRGEIMPNCPEWSQQEKMQNDLTKTLENFASKLIKQNKIVDEILGQKGAIKVGQRTQLHNAWSTFINEINSSLPFLSECMSEAMDKTVTIAKGEIEAFYTSAVHKAGLESINSGHITVQTPKRIELEVSELGGYNIKKGDIKNE